MNEGVCAGFVTRVSDGEDSSSPPKQVLVSGAVRGLAPSVPEEARRGRGAAQR